MTDFVQYNKLTEAGQRVVDHLETALNEAKVKASDNGVVDAFKHKDALNGMAGPYKSYQIFVCDLKTHTPDQWVAENSYAVGTLHDFLEEGRLEEERKVKQEETTTTLEGRIAALEEGIKAELKTATETIKTKDDEIAALKEAAAQTNADDTKPPKRKPGRPAKKKSDEEAPADDAAEETDTDTDD